MDEQQSPQIFQEQQNQNPTIKSPRKSSKVGILIIVLILLIAAAGVGGYLYGHQNVSSQKTQISELNQQLQISNDKLQAADKEAASKTSSTSNVSLNQNLIKIPTLGVQVYVPNSIKDLTITPVQSPGTYNGQPVTSVNVATTTISNDIPQCKNNAFGTLTKYTGQYPASGVALTIWHQQFTNYYLALSPGEASCAPSSTSQVNQDLLQAQSAVFDASLPSIAPTS